VDVRALADELGSALVRAVREGVVDESAYLGGRHRSNGKGEAVISWYAFALEYLQMRWPLIAAKTRNETNDALCAITQAMLRHARGRPSDGLLRCALRDWAFVVPLPEVRSMPADVRLALSWVAGTSRPLAELLDPAVMRAVPQALRLKQDGTVAAPETQRRKRKILVNAVRYAIEQGGLRADPAATVSWRVPRRSSRSIRALPSTPPRPAACSVRSPTSVAIGVHGDGGWWGCSPACTTPGCGPLKWSR
jgi:hypothetical protein